MSEISDFEVMGDRECRELLAKQSVGRIAFMGVSGYPVVMPVNYLIDGDVIAFRTSPGEKFESVPTARVAFQVDGFDPSRRCGWSVLAQGTGQDITDAVGVRYERLRQRTMSPWAPGVKSLWLAIDVHLVSGRRVVSTGEPTSDWFQAYDWQTDNVPRPVPG
jgi:nitroimidazol reductase NimA-like FMN-containing flavoprotein (pyridoxamine 5'-phosphate oxidase superfamily)